MAKQPNITGPVLVQAYPFVGNVIATPAGSLSAILKPAKVLA